jgi:hypothetical protein
VLADPRAAGLLVLGFPLVTVLEVLSPLCLFHRAFRRAWVAGIALFHLFTLIFMGIFFVHNLLLIAFFLTPAPRHLARALAVTDGPRDGARRRGWPPWRRTR